MVTLTAGTTKNIKGSASISLSSSALGVKNGIFHHVISKMSSNLFLLLPILLTTICHAQSPPPLNSTMDVVAALLDTVALDGTVLFNNTVVNDTLIAQYAISDTLVAADQFWYGSLLDIACVSKSLLP